MSYIYLASPYSDPSPEVMASRYVEACRAAAEILMTGRTVYSPIVHFHPIAEAVPSLPRGFDFWSPHNIIMLRHADEFTILRLPGWEDSRGVAAETDIAKAAGLKISFLD